MRPRLGHLVLLALLPASQGLVACGAASDGDGAQGGSASGGRPAPRFVEAALPESLDLARAADGTYFMPDSIAGGCALVDVDGDGRLDVFLAHGVWDHAAGTPMSGGLARLLRQREDGSFEDVSQSAGVVGAHFGIGVATGDVEGDGDVDLYVTCFGPDVLLLNRGDGTFEDGSERIASARTSQWGASATFVDFDVDGDLDVFVTNYVLYEPDADGTYPESGRGTAQAEYASPANFDGTLDALIENQGDGTFVDVSEARGLARPGRGLGVAAGDWDGDGRVDLFVANDGEANHLWCQLEDGTFEERALRLGLAFSGEGRAEAGMGVARGDVDGDGGEDLLLTHLMQETHTLYLSGERGGARTFGDRTVRAGLAAPTLDMTGFGVALSDLNLDGALDLLAVHGRVLRGRTEPGAVEPARWQPYAERNLVALGSFDETRGGPRFEPVDGGAFDDDPETSRGLALGDVDGDGDLDALVTSAAGRVRLFLQAGAPGPDRHWLAVRAVLPDAGGRVAVGAVVEVRTPGRVQRRTVQSCHGYLSASEPSARFGLGAANRADVVVTFPDGHVERRDSVETGQVLVVER